MITPGATSLRGQLDQATDPSPLRDAITAAYRTSEPLAVEQLLAGSGPSGGTPNARARWPAGWPVRGATKETRADRT